MYQTSTIRKTGLILTLVGVILFFLPLLVATPSYSENVIIWNGERATYYGGFVRAAEEFTKKTGIKVVAIPGGCSSGVKGVLTGKIDVGGLCCFPKDNEVNKMGIKAYQYAWEALVIVVNNANRINNLSSQQIRDIFSGKIINWKEVGGQNKPIRVITRLHCKDREGHWRQILADPALFKSSKDVKEDQEVLVEIEKNPDAIGFVSRNMVNPKFVKIVSVNGIMPSKSTLIDGTYPWKMPISFITKGEAKGDIKKFIDFISHEGRAYMNKDLAFMDEIKKDIKAEKKKK
ncbi:MAG: phosphate ABC transporter substrate-binding protein [Thermodesulfovibrionales bacterium]